jgi:hypothetical protein
MATIAGFKNNGGLIEGEIFCLVVLFPDGKICNKDLLYEFKASTNPGRGSWKNSDKGQYFMVLILLVAIPLTIHTLDLLVFKQITNAQGGTAETFETRNNGPPTRSMDLHKQEDGSLPDKD